MHIESNSARATGSRTSDRYQAFVDINSCLCGYGIDIRVYPYMSRIYIVKRTGDPFPHIVVLPSKKWKQDLINEGFEIIGAIKDIERIEASNLRSETTKDEAP